MGRGRRVVARRSLEHRGGDLPGHIDDRRGLILVVGGSGIAPRRSPARLLAALVVAALGVLAAPTTAAAQGGDFSVTPVVDDVGERPFFAYDLQPGDVIEDALRLTNLSADPRTFRVFAADGYNTSDIGTFALRQEDEPRTDIGAWVDLGLDQWTLSGASQIDIPFRLEVPADASPGDHVGGILALQLPTGAAADTEFGLSVQRGIGVRIYLRVVGPTRPSLAIDELRTVRSTPLSPFDSGEVTTSFRVANTGNVRLSPTVGLQVSGPFGEIERTDLGQFTDLLPGNSVVVRHTYAGLPPGGKVTQSITLAETNLNVTRTVSFWVVPWWLLGLTAVAAAAAVVLVRRRRGRDAPTAESRGHAGALSAAVLGLLVLQLVDVPEAGAATDEATVTPDSRVDVGELVTVSGSGWPAGANLVVEICGANAARGTLDCALEAGRTVATDLDGRFALQMTAVAPPSPCPCVVRIWAVTGDSSSARIPLDLRFDDESPLGEAEPDRSSGDAPPAPPTLSVDARLEGAGDWWSWLGGSIDRTLRLTAENTGDRTVSDAVVSLVWGSEELPTGYLPLVPLGAIEAGETVEKRIPLEFDALTFGETRVRGEVLHPNGVTGFQATTSTYPWILLGAAAVIALAGAVALLGWANRLVRWVVRTNAARRDARTRAAVAMVPAPPTVEPEDRADELATIISEELAVVFGTALEFPVQDRIDDDLFIRRIVELSIKAADRAASRMLLTIEERDALDELITDAMLDAFGFVPTGIR